MNDILSKILINKANELKKLDKNIIPIKRQNHYDFFQALKSDKISIIAEVKFKSPSEGLIYKNIDPLKIALEYQNAGADAISIISDSTPKSTSSPVLEIPSPYIISNSTVLNGADTLFLTTLTLV